MRTPACAVARRGGLAAGWHSNTSYQCDGTTHSFSGILGKSAYTFHLVGSRDSLEVTSLNFAEVPVACPVISPEGYRLMLPSLFTPRGGHRTQMPLAGTETDSAGLGPVMGVLSPEIVL